MTDNTEIMIRDYVEEDAPSVGRLIADTFGEFNLAYASPEERVLLLGPFQYAESQDPAHQAAIAEAIAADMVFVAENAGEIVGVLRGRPDKLRSLFVRKDHHRRGIGCRLVHHFEQACQRQEATVIKVQATLFAVPFYQSVGYKKTTGIRSCRIFEGTRFPYQPMKKILRET
ncbi:MAG: GNAT family N-acetyltransferase [Anaerolineae bacterium]|nr:GNAT family N-acetyltransferase [Anaerolineae bacterium]